MTNQVEPDRGDQASVGKTRTWWHPLLVRLLDHVLDRAYAVQEEVTVGRLPLRVDILLDRQQEGELSDAARGALPALIPLLNRFTLIEFKGPTDALGAGDLAQVIGRAFLWHSQQSEGISSRDVSLIILAPRSTSAFRRDLELLGLTAAPRESGVWSITGACFTMWLLETDVMAERGEPILSLVSHAILRDRPRIIEQLKRTGHAPLLFYTLQLIQQFDPRDKDFAMRHSDLEYLDEVEEELKLAVLEKIPAEDRVRGLSPEERLQGLSPEERLQGLSPEERLQGLAPEERLQGLAPEERLQGLAPEERLQGLAPEERLQGLSEEELARLRALLERPRGN